MNDDPLRSSSDILDQSEIDKLLASAEIQQRQSIFMMDGTRADSIQTPKIEAYDFRNPVFLTEVELRRLRILHEDFIRYLSARLSLFLRMECTLKMSKLTTLSYQKFTEALPSPTHLVLFKAEPLMGVGILDVNPRLALTIADRMLGGRGHSVKAERFLTEIEVGLIEDIIVIILEEWCAQWKQEQELHPQIIGHESNGRFLQTSPKDAVMLALTLEADFGDCAEQLQIGVPYYTIEPLVKAMQARRAKDATVSSETTNKKTEWQPIYEKVTIPIRAEWDAFELSLREIVSLKVGDVIEMSADVLDKTRVLLNGNAKFQGSVGLDSDRVAIKLHQRIIEEKNSHAKS